ncbi:MAG: diaminopimelate decarboxylase [Halobacteriota archaeon]
MFTQIDGKLHVEGVSVEEIAKIGTPVYITSKEKLEKNIHSYQEAFPQAKILYAVKANNNISLMKVISRSCGADVFSGGELYVALLAGFKPEEILFNGNSKTDQDIQYGVKAGVKFSVDSFDELHTISAIAQQQGKDVKIAFRINPDISPDTHPKIATGLKKSKFGIPWEQVMDAYKEAVELSNVTPVGIHCHIGSQITELEPFVEVLNRLFDVAAWIEDLGVSVEFLDMGGGLGIDYEGKGVPSPSDLAENLMPVFNHRVAELSSNPQLWLEPGRSIIGDTTILLTGVNSVKRAYKNFASVDAGFNLLIRPVMYDAYHRVSVANKMDIPDEDTYTIVGPICESGDAIAEDRRLPRLEKGDLIAVYDSGAYGFAMSSQYNGRMRCPEVLVNGDNWYVIRDRENYYDIVGKQIITDLDY